MRPEITVFVIFSILGQVSHAQTTDRDQQGGAAQQQSTEDLSRSAEATPQSSCPPKPGDPAEARNIAGEMFADGDKFIEAHKYLKALFAFTCSLKMVQHPATLFNINQSAELVQETEPAIDLLRSFLAAGHAGESENRVREILTTLEDRHRALHPGTPSPGPEQPAETPSSTTQPEVPVTEAAVTKDVATKQDRWSRFRIPAYVTAGTGVASLCVAAVLFGLEGHYYNRGRDTRNWGDFQDYQSKVENYQTGGIVMTTIGALATATGITFLLLSKKEKEKKATPVSLITTTHSLTIVGKF